MTPPNNFTIHTKKTPPCHIRWNIFPLPQRTDQLHHSNKRYPNFKKERPYTFILGYPPKRNPYQKRRVICCTNFSSTKKPFFPMHCAPLWVASEVVALQPPGRDEGLGPRDPTTPTGPVSYDGKILVTEISGWNVSFKKFNKNNTPNKINKTHSYCCWGTT